MDFGPILVYLISGVVGLVIFYFIIEAAVRNGIIEAKSELLVAEKRAAAQAKAAKDASTAAEE